MKRIYLDYASLTPIDPRVLREMKAYSGAEYANPSSIYKEGVAAKKAMEDGRKRVAGFLRAHADEIVFTSGGTEANGLVIEGCGRAAHRVGNTKPHMIISNIEHSSIMETANMMEKQGVEVTRLAVGPDGLVMPDELRKAIRPNTFLVSIMTVNNEIGSIQPIREIAKAIRYARANVTKSSYPMFHTDASQAAIFMDLNVEKLGVDLLTLDASKMYGPRGIGALFIRRGTPIEQIIYGGGQERGLRSGTENIPAIIGFAKSLDIITTDTTHFGTKNVSKRIGAADDMHALKTYFFDGLKEIRSDIVMNPSELDVNNASLSPHILNVSIPGIDNEFFVLQLDARGVAVSTKSSCLRDAAESYVLKAIGADSRASVRFSFGRFTKKGDLKRTLRAVAEILSKRAVS